MQLLESLTLAALLALPGGKALKRRPALFYGIAGLVAIATVWGVWSGAIGALPSWAIRWGTALCTRGTLSAALFFFVMYANAVPDGSPFLRRVMPIRGELSIVASIMAVGHGAALVRGQLAHVSDRQTAAALAVSLALLAVMLPLFVTSFRKVRRRMRPKAWKRLQRGAYAFYALLAAHILLALAAKARGASLELLLYAGLFLGYAALRGGKALAKRGSRLRRAPGAVCAAAFCAIVFWQGFAMGISVPAGSVLAEAAAIPIPAEAPASAPEEAAPAASLTDGVYTGAGVGYNGRLTVTLTVEEGRIASVAIRSSVDDEEYVDDVTARLLPAVVAAQSPDVDAVSGATSTSLGVLDAVADALSKAASEAG